MNEEFEFISNVKYYRNIKKYTQEELAKLVGVRRETILRLEQNKFTPSLRLALNLEKVLDTPVSVLFQCKNKI